MYNVSNVLFLLLMYSPITSADITKESEYQVSYASKSLEDQEEDREEYVEDSLERVEESRKDSIDKVHDTNDDIQDSIQEYRIGMEGRRLRVSFINYFTLHNYHLRILPEFAIVDRIAFFEFGFNGISFNPSDKNGEHQFLSVAPVAGIVPVLSRPVRASFGAGMAMQFETTDHMASSFAPFAYITGTVFFVKRVSTSITARFLHDINGRYCYWGSGYYPKKEGNSWSDLGLSIDFYF